MKFTSTQNELSIRVSRKIRVLMRMRNLIPTLEQSSEFSNLILPQLTYCQTLSLWHFCRKSDSTKMETQERALRSACCDKSSTYDKLLARAKFPSLQNRRLQEIAIIMYKGTNSLCLGYISDIFNF